MASEQTLMEKLGYSSNTKLLILHADDGGLLQSVNHATQTLMENGGITSASYMIPAPWVYQTVDYYSQCSQCDMGLHIVLNSEWQGYRWGPAAPAHRVRSLIDPLGTLWTTREEYLENATTKDTKREIEAQIIKAYKLGFKPSHLDTHMGTVYTKPKVLQEYVRLAREYRLIPMLPKWSADLEAYLQSRLYYDVPALKELLIEFEKKNYVMLDRLVPDVGGSSKAERMENYLKMIRSLPVGLTQVIVHLSDPSDEFDSIIKQRPKEIRRYWDVDILQSSIIKQTISEENIVLTSWKQLQQMQYPSLEKVTN